MQHTHSARAWGGREHNRGEEIIRITAIADSQPEITLISRTSIQIQGESAQRQDRKITAVDLYGDVKSASSALVRAQSRLEEAILVIDAAIAEVTEDLLTSDVHVQQLRPILTRLFVEDSLGEGFDALVSALVSALQNSHGLPLNEGQLRLVRKTLVGLREEPFMSFDAAVTIIEKLENGNFSTEPNGFESLADWLNQ